MRRIILTAVCVVVTSLGPLYAQGLVVAAGYADPAFIRLAPGQVTTIYVAGLTN